MTLPLASVAVLGIIGGAVSLVVGSVGVFFWGSGLGWRDRPKDPRNGL
jgi:hypothetical protein